MHKEIFGGIVTVYVDEPSPLNNYCKMVEINWSAIGSTSIERTELFIEHLQAAVKRAKELQ